MIIVMHFLLKVAVLFCTVFFLRKSLHDFIIYYYVSYVMCVINSYKSHADNEYINMFMTLIRVEMPKIYTQIYLKFQSDY